ncbi:MAG: TolC family protein [Gemmatimonadaceae bacterium]
MTTLARALLALALLSPLPLAAQRSDSLAAAPAPPTDSSARPISLDEAIRLAKRNAPAAVQARGTERTSRAAVTSAYGAFIPNVSVSLGGVRQFTGAGDRTRINPQTNAVETLSPAPWSYSSGLSLNLNLFEGGSRIYGVRSAKAGVRAAEASAVAQEFDVALSVQQQYFAVLAAHESEAAARAQLEEAQQQLTTSSAKLRAGAATTSDSLRSVIQVGNAQLALLNAQTALRNADAALTRLVASPVPVTAQESDSLDVAAAVALDSATLARLAAEGPAVRQAAAQLGAASASAKAARAPYLPTVTASYSRAGSGTDPRFGYGSDPYQYNGRLSLGLSYPLFNQFTREESVVRARVAEDNAEATLRDTRLAAQQQLVQALSTLRTAQQQIAIQQASVSAAEEDLRVQRQRYQLGASTLLDVLTSQTQLAQARSALIQARYDARVARAQLEAVIGQELP